MIKFNLIMKLTLQLPRQQRQLLDFEGFLLFSNTNTNIQY